ARVISAAKFKKLSGMWQFANLVLGLLEMSVKPFFQLTHRDARRKPIVELAKWQTEFGLELIQGHLLQSSLMEDVIRRLPHTGKVIHQGAGPIEDDVPNHGSQCSHSSWRSPDQTSALMSKIAIGS